jgi:hypothetical protein
METFLKQCQEILEAQGFTCSNSEQLPRNLLYSEVTNDKEDDLQVIIEHYPTIPDKGTALRVVMRQRFFHQHLFHLNITEVSEIMQLLAKEPLIRTYFPTCLTGYVKRKTQD